MKTRNILRYGLMKRFKKGVRISISLTYRCNLQCSYCSIAIPTGKMPVAKESSLNELKAFINKFPYKIKEVWLTGGSPELHPEFVEFTDYLLNKGFFVMIYSNLMDVNILNKLPENRRLLITGSYHHKGNWESISVDDYCKSYNILKKKYRINIEEIGEKRLSFSKLKSFSNIDQLKNNNKTIRISPDLKMYCTCFDIYNNI